MARFKFHYAIEELLINDYACAESITEKAVQKAADSGDLNLNDNMLDDLTEKIYCTQKYWD